MSAFKKRPALPLSMLLAMTVLTPLHASGHQFKGWDSFRSSLGAIGERVLFTRLAVERTRRMGLREFLDSDPPVSSVDGWNLIHLPGEDLTVIKRRADKNAEVWGRLSNKRFAGPATLLWDGVTGDNLRMVLFRLCGVQFQIESEQSLAATLVVLQPTSAEQLCQSFPLIFAANNILLQERRGQLKGKLDNQQKGGRSILNRVRCSRFSPHIDGTAARGDRFIFALAPRT